MPFFAFFFESVGGGEWLVLLAVILIVVGPKNLPSAARKIGKVMSQLRRAADEFKRQLMTMDDEMRRAAEDIKKEYVQIPDMDSPSSSTSSASDAPADSPSVASAESAPAEPAPTEGQLAYPGHSSTQEVDEPAPPPEGAPAEYRYTGMPSAPGDDPDSIRREDANHEQVSTPAEQS